MVMYVMYEWTKMCNYIYCNDLNPGWIQDLCIINMLLAALFSEQWIMFLSCLAKS